MQPDVLALGQGLYYVATGVSPRVSLRTFEAVTGPKTDRWLVKTGGVLVSVIGAVIVLAGLRRRGGPRGDRHCRRRARPHLEDLSA